MKLILTTLFLISFSLNGQNLKLISFGVTDKYYTNTNTACVQVQISVNSKYAPRNVVYNYSDDAEKNRKSMGNFIILEDKTGENSEVRISLSAVCGDLDTTEYKQAGYSIIEGFNNYFYNDSIVIYVICPNFKDKYKALVVSTEYKKSNGGLTISDYNWFFEICKSIEIYECCDTID